MDDIAFKMLDFVCRSVSYRSDNGEWWEFPAETLAARQSDCDGSAILLCSLLRNFTNAYVAVGEYRGLGHAWVVTGNGEILETTFTSARPVPDPQNYHAYAFFNDQEVLEVYQGAMARLFQLVRNEHQKLTLMAKAANK